MCDFLMQQFILGFATQEFRISESSRSHTHGSRMGKCNNMDLKYFSSKHLAPKPRKNPFNIM